ncbi:MAG TPA: hypothetical protein VJ991_05900 [Balneolales bacterium]|nr:hypothetical protein [Balneolales bacterium]
MILIIKRVWKDEPNNLIDYLKKIENQVIFLHISFIESFRQSDSIITFKKVKKNLTQRHSLFIVAVLLIIIIGIVYIYKINAVFEYAEPLSREWFFNINRVKEIRLQNYFGNVPSAAGLFALVDLLSLAVHVEPEIILHIFGIFINAWIMVLITWVSGKIIDEKGTLIPLTGAIIYIFFISQLFPIPSDYFIEANSLMLSLSFALPVLLLMGSKLVVQNRHINYIVLFGLLAVGLTNVFIFLVTVVLALLQIAALNLYRRLNNRLNSFYIVAAACVVIVLIYSKYLYTSKVSIYTFLKSQLFATNIYSFLPDKIVIPIKIISLIALGISTLFILKHIAFEITNHRTKNEINISIDIIIMTLAFIYVLENDSIDKIIDYDQLNTLYVILLSIYISIIIWYLYKYIRVVFAISGKYWIFVESIIVITVLAFSYNYTDQSDPFQVTSKKRTDHFFKAYYKINRNYLPYTYTIIAPSIDSTLAKNRHYFMDYSYFLSDYRKMDSLYKVLPIDERPKLLDNIRTTNLFIFIENPPYSWLSEGVIPDQQKVMLSMNEWVFDYKYKGYNNLKVYYKSPEFTVYELINNTQNNSQKSILFPPSNTR